MASVDINIDDVYWKCSHREKMWLAEKLEIDGYLKSNGLCLPESISATDEWYNTLTHLASIQLQMTREEEIIIKGIIKKYDATYSGC